MKPEDLPFKTQHELSDRVVVVRGLKVILDSDLAALYGVATKSLRSQIATLRPGRPPRRRFLPYVFTEGGALMASGLLKSPRAIEISIALARASVIWP